MKLESRLVDLGDEPCDIVLATHLEKLGARDVRHRGESTLFEHLSGTRDIIRRWGGRQALQRAAMCHSLYSTECYTTSLLDLGQRFRLSSIIGNEAEQLCYYFAQCERSSVLDACAKPPISDQLRVRCHTQPNEELFLRRGEAADLLMLYAANLADQAQSAGPDAFSWVNTTLNYLKASNNLGWFHYPILSYVAVDDQQAELSLNEAFTLIDHRLCDMDLEKLTHLATRTSAGIFLPELWFWLSLSRLAAGELRLSQEAAREGATRIEQLGFVTDKRLTFEEWSMFLRRLATSEVPLYGASDLSAVRDPVTAFEILSGPPIQIDTLQRQLRPLSERLVRAPHPVQPTVREALTSYIYSGLELYPGLGSSAYFDTSDIPLARALERDSSVIAREVACLATNNFHAEAERIEREGQWDVLMLFERGRKHIRNCSLLPATTRLLERYNIIRTFAGLTYVSRLRANSRISAHCGPTNLRLRCHLGLSIPAGDCGVRVSGVSRNWEQGKCLVFNDYLEHDAWNNTAQDRTVLIVDMWHPDLSGDEVKQLEQLHGLISKQATQLDAYWANNAIHQNRRRLGYD